jgi:hypothetical protein
MTTHDDEASEQHLHRQISYLECALAALALKFGVPRGSIDLSSQDLHATLGHGLELEPCGDGIRIRAITPAMIAARNLPAITHDCPARFQ